MFCQSYIYWEGQLKRKQLPRCVIHMIENLKIQNILRGFGQLLSYPADKSVNPIGLSVYK